MCNSDSNNMTVGRRSKVEGKTKGDALVAYLMSLGVDTREKGGDLN